MSSQTGWIGRRLVFEAGQPARSARSARDTSDAGDGFGGHDRLCSAVVYSAADGRWFVHYRSDDVVDATRAAVVLVFRERPAEVWLPEATAACLCERCSPALASTVVGVLDSACANVGAEFVRAASPFYAAER
ncbi:hypothetical protein [Halocalculus aciditolerans]|uniref:Uncharacterized protein n=1 Tax=Halocalculus aciditolerans TaxID=1383812 RepID=A0A830F3T7_9EURY|nr:hypothetical protein [Halocalculus aciditolerans]GGL52368.1 hypothetical protein GCM10009039_08320 [Halocalculus aciditolerans]